jgi:hypothetical protein
MRKQYYFRRSPEGLLAWDIDRLVLLARDLHVRSLPISQIRELDESVLGEDEPVTWRALVAHIELVDAADLAYPIVLAADGCVMDGRHRVVKALLQGRSTIDAVQFVEDPTPDYVGKRPDELPY